MPDDLVINVRQVGQYPFRTNPAGDYWVSQHDLVLLQKDGAAGNPYASTCCVTLVSTAGATPGVEFPFGWGETPPANCAPAQVFVPYTVLPLETSGMLGFNAYLDSTGVKRNWQGGASGALGVDIDGNFKFTAWLGNTAGAALGGATTPFNIAPNGYLVTPDTLRVGRDPATSMEVATAQFVDAAVGVIQDEIDHLFDHDIHIGGALYVAQHAYITCGLDVYGSASITGGLEVGCGLSVNGDADISGDLSLGGKLDLNGPLSLMGDLTVGGVAEFENLAAFDWNVLMGRNLDVCGTATLGTLAVERDACVNGNLGVEKDMGVLGDVDVLNSLDVGQNATIDGHVGIGGSLAVCQTITQRGHEVIDCESLGGVLTDVTRSFKRYVGNEIEAAGIFWLDLVHGRYAPLYSPNFRGMPTGPTPEAHSSDDKLATTAFVMGEIAHHTAGVASWNQRTGHVELAITDIIDAGGAPIHSPHFTGWPEAETAAPGTATRVIASTEFVHDAIDESRRTSVTSFNNRVGDVVLVWQDVDDVGGAPIRNPDFLGSAFAPTPPATSDDRAIATTEWVHNLVTHETSEVQKAFARLWHKYNHHTVWSFNQRTGNVVFRASDLSAVGGAFLASPHFTGIPTAPTAPPQTDTNQLATTAYVDAAIASNPGPVGPAGPMGPIGPAGKSWQIMGSVDDVSQLPTEGNNAGDVWLDDSTGVGYVWSGHAWKPVGYIRGAQGPEGPQGEIGPIGPTGTNVFMGPPPPSSAPVGALFWDSSQQTLFVNTENQPPNDNPAWLNTAIGTLVMLQNYLPLAGGTLTGALNIGPNVLWVGSVNTNMVPTGSNTRIGGGTVRIDSWTGTSRLDYFAQNVQQWDITGFADLIVNRYVSGAATDIPFRISNSTGAVTIPNLNATGSKLNLAYSANGDGPQGAGLVFSLPGNAGWPLVIRGVDDGGLVYIGTGNIKIDNLPTSDPNDQNVLWNDGGTLKVSAG
jgi:hypothetical protein